MSAAAYDAWYQTKWGRYVGDTEFRLLWNALLPKPAESLLDIGCGTGYFSRRFAKDMAGRVVGIDLDGERLALARTQAVAKEPYIEADALNLPFPDNSFDLAISITALSFMIDPRQALAEMLRVSRRRFAVALLNRYSLLYRKKGRPGGTGGYQGACWHSSRQARQLFDGLPVTDLKLTSAIFLTTDWPAANFIDSLIPKRVLFGGFLLITGNKTGLQNI